MRAPLTNLVCECGHTKVTKKKNTKKNLVHQKSFDEIKMVMAREIMLAYPDYNQPFEVYTDGSLLQLGVVIVQNGRPIAFLAESCQKPRGSILLPKRNS